MKAMTSEQRAAAIAAACQCWTAPRALEFRASPTATTALSPAELDEVLAKAVARERVELVLEVLAYEQGERDANGKVIKNRNGVRLRAGAVSAAGRTGKGMPYLADHAARAANVGGRIIESKAVKVDDGGHYQIFATVLLAEPTFVERAARGLSQGVSIRFWPTGPVICTACGTEVFTACWHCPFDVVKNAKGEDVEVEWEISSAEIVELSECAIPAVPTAGIQAVRAAFAAPTPVTPSGTTPRRNPPMSLTPALAAYLGISVDATEAEIDAATAKKSAGPALSADEQRIQQLEADLEKSTVDEFIAGGLAEGRMKPAEEATFRALFKASPDRARAALAKREIGSQTPAGLPAPSTKPDPTPPTSTLGELAGGDRDAKTRAALKGMGRDPDRVLKFAKAFGAKDPKAAVAKYGAGITEEI